MASPRTAARWAALTVGLVLILGGCGGTAGGVGQQAAASVVPSAAPTTLPYPDVVMPQELRGTWIANVQRPGPSNGIWRLRISEHLMELKNPGSASDSDYFWLPADRIDGTSFHLAQDSGCPEITYQYTVTGSQLVMTTTRPQPTTTNDTCGDPVVILTTPWKRDS